MRAVVIIHKNDKGELQILNLPEPIPGPQELLISIKATGLNRADLYQLQGTYVQSAPDPSEGSPTIVGLEAAGIVMGMGNDVSGFTIGERVMGICTGGYAEFTTLDYRLALPVPPVLSWEEAAAIPLASMTAYNALVMNGSLKPMEAVLVNAASSGVGVLAVQIAKLLGAQPVIGLSTSSEKLRALRKLGADFCINCNSDNFAGAVLEATKDKGVDVVIDHLGGPYLEDNLRCMAVKGRLVSVGRLAGTTTPLNLELLALKRLHLIGVTFRTRTLEEKIKIARGVAADLLPFFENGQLRPIIDKIFALDEATEAQSYMMSNVHFGKIVLRI